MSISKAEHDELCCVYAGLLLFDDGMEITADKIEKIIKASGNEVDGYYPEFFAKYLSKADIKSMLTVAPAAGGAAHEEEHHEDKKDDKKGGKTDDKKGGKKGKEKEKEKEKTNEIDEVDDGGDGGDVMGFGDIFGDS